jgi:hypothetical protein
MGLEVEELSFLIELEQFLALSSKILWVGKESQFLEVRIVFT